MNRGYEYRGLAASSWDLLRGDTSQWPDRPFYRRIIAESGEPALDVGCGTGRLLLDYLAAGVDVEGVDVSPEMLAICRGKGERMGLRPVLYEQALEELQLPRSYRTVFIPSSSFQLITDSLDARRALQRARAHLERGGAFVMSIMDVSGPAQGGWQLVGAKERATDGLLVRRWLKSQYDEATQLVHTEDRYELLKDGQILVSETHRRSPATRGYSLGQIVELVRAGGFDEVRTVSGFSDEPASDDDELFCVIAR